MRTNADDASETSSVVRERAACGHAAAVRRQGKPNARLTPGETMVQCRCDAQAEPLLAQAMRRFALSARSYHRVLRIARTIADLAGVERIAPAHMAEAIGYRRLDTVSVHAARAPGIV